MLSRSHQRMATVKRPAPGVPGNAFQATGHTVNAAVYPMSGTATAQMYGLQPAQMRVMYFASGDDVLMGDGVCVDVAANAEPDFRAVYVALYGRHGVAHLRFIPVNERGADA